MYFRLFLGGFRYECRAVAPIGRAADSKSVGSRFESLQPCHNFICAWGSMNKNNNYKKIITLSFVIAGFLVAFVANVLMETASAAFGSVARLMTVDAVKHGVPIVLGLATFAALQFNKKVLVWAEEVVSEIDKVVWPSYKDTSAMTIVVSIMLLFAGVALGLMDMMSNYVVGLMVK